MKTLLKPLLASVLLLSTLVSGGLHAQVSTPGKPVAISADNAVMLTVFLKHDQSRNLNEIRTKLTEQELFKVFPPEGVEIVSWNIAMGIGHVIVLRFPASRLREVNLAIERSAWGPFRTEFFPTYDYMDIVAAEQSKVRKPIAAK
ncbi:hypothetical protein QMK52_22535 [Pseudomonas sp. P9_2]|uniref:hypothetical protein n=1 Tax=Pseudomonas sp. P9_2 TaxID=3043447 RepID=UPI002A363A38|nr:hypothetical protein [Pseudomonas sp. P9_2]WPN51654.1 hypothetical protein QMK52_22535 [Pseudomonas sp. P9_2]